MGTQKYANIVAPAGTASNISVEMIGANAAGLGFVDGVPAADIHHVSGGVRSSGFYRGSHGCTRRR